MSTAPQTPKKFTILVLESHDVAMAVAQQFLVANGFDVSCVRDGDLALIAATGRHRPDAALLNYRLDRRITTDVVRAIRKFEADHQKPRLPLVLASAEYGTPWESECLAAGADRTLPMPFSDRELVAAVHGALSDVRRSWRSLSKVDLH